MVGRCSTSAIKRAQNVGSPPKDAHASGLPDEWAGLLSSEIDLHGCAEPMGLGEGNTH